MIHLIGRTFVATSKSLIGQGRRPQQGWILRIIPHPDTNEVASFCASKSSGELAEAAAVEPTQFIENT